MHHRLRVHDHVDPVGRHPEQPARLDDLKPLVHQRRRVHGDLPPHAPGGMVEGIGRRDIPQSFEGPVAKRSARGGQDQPFHLVGRPSVETLMDRVVLAVDRENRDPAPPGRLHDEPTGHDKHLLVGQRDRLARFDRGEHRVERRRAGGRAQHQIDVGMRGDGQQTCGTGERPLEGPGRRCRQPRPHRRQCVVGRHRDDTRAMPLDLFGESRRVGAGRQTDHVDQVGMRHRDRERAAPDGSGRPEDGDASHKCPVVTQA